MKTIRTLLVAGIWSASVLSASPANAATPLAPAPSSAQIMTDLGGTVHIQQSVPCGDPVDLNSSITQGRMEITPRMLGDKVFFDLTRLDVFLTPFSVGRACGGISAVADFSEIGVRLAGAVRFQGQAAPSTNGALLYRFVIPKKSFLIFESVLDNMKRRRPETAYQRPSRHVTGLIELIPTDGGMVIKRVQLNVALHTKLHFQAGCVTGGACAIDKVEPGTQTTQLVASPGDTPPTGGPASSVP